MRFLALLVPFIAFFFGYVGVLFYTHAKTVTVPSVVGKTLYKAVSVLGTHNLGLKLLNVKDDAFLPEGTIISQIPIQGQQIKPAKSVFVVMTKKPQPFLMPAFFGKGSKQIFDALKDSNVSVKIVPLSSNKEAKGNCFAQYPNRAGQTGDGKAVAYIASAETALYIMPSLEGFTLSEAKNFLQAEGVSFEVFTFFTDSRSEDKLVVTDQKPMPGTIITLDNSFHVQLKADVSE